MSYYSRNRLRIKKEYDDNRNKIFDILGGKFCVKCKYDDERSLEFDHINGNGKEERKKYSYPGMIRYYAKHPSEAKNRLQILCRKCNQEKRYSDGRLGGRPKIIQISRNSNLLDFM